MAIKAWDVNGNNDRFGSRRKKRDLIPGYCEICGLTCPPPTKHRIKPGKEKGGYRMGNVIGLCNNHHWMADHNRISRATLFEIVQIRLQRQNGRQA